MRTFDNLRFTTKLGVIIILSSGMALCILCVAFLAYDLRGSRLSVEDRLSTLASIVGENSTAALQFLDPTAAAGVLGALHSERSLVSACLYDKAGSLFAQYQRSQAPGASGCPEVVPNRPRNDRYYIGTVKLVMSGGEMVGLSIFSLTWRKCEDAGIGLRGWRLRCCSHPSSVAVLQDGHS